MSARLYVGDALEIMRGLPTMSVDAIITDPPYCSGGSSEAERVSANGQGLRSETLAAGDVWFRGDQMGTQGLLWLMRSMAAEATRLLCDGGWLLVFCDWRMVAALGPAIESAGLRWRALLCWDKGNPGLGLGFRPQHEMVLGYTLGTPVQHDTSASNVLSVPRTARATQEHPTQKPVELMARLIRATTGGGTTVLDPFCGSGTTGVAAVQLGREFIGIERDPAYVEVAARRLTDAGVTVDAVGIDRVPLPAPMLFGGVDG